MAVVVAKSKFECDGKAVMFSPSGHVTGIASDDGVATVLVDGATAAGSDVCGALVIQAVEAATCEGSRALLDAFPCVFFALNKLMPFILLSCSLQHRTRSAPWHTRRAARGQWSKFLTSALAAASSTTTPPAEAAVAPRQANYSGNSGAVESGGGIVSHEDDWEGACMPPMRAIVVGESLTSPHTLDFEVRFVSSNVAITATRGATFKGGDGGRFVFAFAGDRPGFSVRGIASDRAPVAQPPSVTCQHGLTDSSSQGFRTGISYIE
ncbi:MAG: hypothetical protein SGPRY_007465 [Prymnesium sp.]